MKILNLELKDLKIDYPVDNYSITQGFGANATSAYARDGLLGHTGIDFGGDFDSPIYSVTRGQGYIYKTFNRDNPDLNKYRAVCELLHLKDYTLEFSYGHCNCIYCQIGQAQPREKIASMGNTGEVYSRGRLVTIQEKQMGSTDGRHLHFQIRKCNRVPQPVWTGKNYYLLDDNGNAYSQDGYYFEYAKDGYNGCIDPMPFFEDDLTDEQRKNIQSQINIARQMILDLQKMFAKLLKK